MLLLVKNILCTAIAITIVNYVASRSVFRSFARPTKTLTQNVNKLLRIRGGNSPEKSEEKLKGTCIGIDLGTTYSCVAVWKNGRVEVCPNEQGNRITPSYVAWTQGDGQRLVGDAAKNQAAVNPSNTVFDVKRLIGRKYSDASVQKDAKLLPYKIVAGNGDKPLVQVKVGEESKTFAPEEISALILRKMKETAETFLGETVNHAVVTVPAYFNDAQRQATKDAGTIAGLKVERVLNEPTAAAIAYGLDRSTTKEENILVFDLGGGTFDVTLLTIDNGVFEVKATAGDTHLGGEDFDQRLMDFCINQFQKKHGVSLAGDSKAIARLRRQCEGAKRTLSTQTSTQIEVSAQDKASGKSQKITITSDKGRLSEDEIERMVKEAEENAEADRTAKENIESRNQLESYLYGLRSSVQDTLKDKLSEEEKTSVLKAAADTLTWLESHQQESKITYDEKRKEVEAIATPIITKAYGATENPDNKGDDDQPTVEEVDE